MNNTYQLPGGTTLRRPDSFTKGEPIKISKLIRLKSKFSKPDNSTPEKLVILYECFGMKFHTYMPCKYDNSSDQFIEDINSKILAGDNIRVVFYGKVSDGNEIDFLMSGEEVTQAKLDGIRTIEEAEVANKRA